MPEQFLELFAALARPFDPSEVKKRPQGTRQIEYVTARSVMNRLDDVLGPANWWDSFAVFEHSVVCSLTIRLPDGTTVTKCDAGGAAGMSDQGDDDKSMYSDALKRAAVKFGIGRHLYRDGLPRFVEELSRPRQQRPAAPQPQPHHAANHDNGTGHGSGAYADAGTLKAYQAWLADYCTDVNAKWLDAATDGHGNVKADAELISTWQLSGHLLKWARAGGRVNAPEDARAGQRDKFVAVAWARDKAAVEAEAQAYCRHLWREARAKLTPKPEAEGDEIPESMSEADVWPEGRE